METAGLLVGPMHMRAVLKSVEVARGAPCVMTIGPVLMPEWCADNLDFPDLVIIKYVAIILCYSFSSLHNFIDGLSKSCSSVFFSTMYMKSVPCTSVQSYQLAILIVQDQLLTLSPTLGEELAQSSWMMWHALDQSPD